MCQPKQQDQKVATERRPKISHVSRMSGRLVVGLLTRVIVDLPYFFLQQAPGTFAFLPPLRPLPDLRYLHRLLNLFPRTRPPTNIRRARGKTFRVARASPASRAFPRSTPCAVARTAVTDSSLSAPDQSPTSISTTNPPLSLYLQKKQDVSISVGAVCMVRGMHTRRTISTTDPRVSHILPHHQSPARPSISVQIPLSSTITTWTSVTTTTTVGSHVFPACPVCPACPAYPSHPSRPPFPTTVFCALPSEHSKYSSFKNARLVQ